MQAYYSVNNRELTIYDKDGTCLVILINFDIYDVQKKYGIRDEDIHIAL